MTKENLQVLKELLVEEIVKLENSEVSYDAGIRTGLRMALNRIAILDDEKDGK